MNESQYSDLITKIQKKRKWVIALTIVAVLLVILLTSPIKLEVMGETVVDYKGLHPVLTILLVFLCFFIEIVAYAMVSLPLNTSMDQECDPEKHLILNSSLNKQKNIDYVYSVDHLYLGNYTESIKYAEKMIASANEPMVMVGLFNKARCEFLAADYDTFTQTASQYSNTLSKCRKIKPRAMVEYQKISRVIDLMLAVSKDDLDTINKIRSNIEVWNASKATGGFVSYIKGIAAYKANDKEEAIYRLKAVEEHCSKTILARLAAEHLDLLKE